MENPVDPEYLSPAQAAAYLSVSPHYLQRLRDGHIRGVYLPYIQINDRVIRYRRSDLDDFMDKFRKEPCHATEEEAAED